MQRSPNDQPSIHLFDKIRKCVTQLNKLIYSGQKTTQNTFLVGNKRVTSQGVKANLGLPMPLQIPSSFFSY